MKANAPIHAGASESRPASAAPITVLVVDDHPVVREGIANMVRQQRDLRVVAEGADGEEAVAAWERHRPDVTLLDLRMPLLDGVAAIVRIRKMDPRARIIVLTTYDNQEDLSAAMRAGARAYLLKETPRTELLACIRRVASGETCLSDELAQKLAGCVAAPQLTGREREVLQLAALGNSNKEIAAVLAIGDGTVKAHLKSVFEKLDALSRTEAVHIARQRGLILS